MRKIFIFISELFETEILSATETKVDEFLDSDIRLLQFNTKDLDKIELLQQSLIRKIEMQNLISNTSLN